MKKSFLPSAIAAIAASVMKRAACVAAGLLMAATAVQAQNTVNVFKVMNQFRYDETVNQFLLIRYTGGSNCHIQFYVKDKGCDGKPTWTIDRELDGFVGRNGMGKVRQGDKKTPVGVFSVLTAYGIKSNPGTKLDYVDVTDDIWCCACEKYYNQIISAKETGHACHGKGEHMVEYSPDYNYGMFIDYNKERTLGRGAAIFIHCTGCIPSTAGCVAMPEPDMKYILQHSDRNIKVCIQ